MSSLQLYIIGMNLFSFILMGWDKLSAIKGKWRISEKVLLSISLLGGSIGTLFGMLIFHHKTKKPLFQIIIPLSILINGIIIYFYQ